MTNPKTSVLGFVIYGQEEAERLPCWNRVERDVFRFEKPRETAGPEQREALREGFPGVPKDTPAEKGAGGGKGGALSPALRVLSARGSGPGQKIPIFTYTKRRTPL